MKNRSAIYLTVLLVVMFIPWLGLRDYTTKGEPREAVVALSMLQQHDWILPMNNGGDIPYKPPFFHWVIATLSLPVGTVTEATSRLPSALAAIAMTLAVFFFVRKRKGEQTALVTALLLVSNFELFRAATDCRVDMMLTSMTILALLALYRWYERGMRSLPWLATLFMSLACLTKGPVGIIIPCFVIGVFLLLRRKNFWVVAGKLFLSALLACVLPAMWYVAAYQHSGDAFLNLAMEENFGRMMGRMSYESHKHPFTYNFTSLLAGWLPWTIVALIGLFQVRWKELSRSSFVAYWRSLSDVDLFSWLGFLLILFFYCLPSSKRSVYLLPCYPFMAMLMAEWFMSFGWFSAHKRRIFVPVFVILIALNAAILPMIMNKKSGRPIANTIEQRYGEENLYAFVGSPMLHFFMADFYTHDAIKQFEKDMPTSGILIIARKDTADFMQRHSPVYSFSKDITIPDRRNEMKDTLIVYQFKKK